MKDLLLSWVAGRRVRHAVSKINHLHDNTGYRHDTPREWLFSMQHHNSVVDQHNYLSFADISDTNFTENEQFESELEPTNSTPISTENNYLNEVAALYRIVVPILLTFCCLSFVFNIVIVFSVRLLRRNLSPTMFLSLSLAVADAYASLVIGVGLVVNSLLPIAYGYVLGPMYYCFILSLEAFRLGGLVVSVLHLQALAINHYVGILRPLHYAHIVTRKTTLIAIGFMWVFPVVFFLVYFSSIPNDGFQSEHCSNHTFLMYSPFRVTTSVMFFFPLVLMTVMYSHMFLLVRQHQKGLLQCPSSRSLHKNVKAIITTLLILGTYILGWMPAVMFYVLTCLDCVMPFTKIPIYTRVPVGIFINVMIVAKSFVDPVIYVVRMPEIKCALKAVWFTRCGQTDEYYPTPTPSRTDVKRLTLLTSRRKSRMSMKNISPNKMICSPNGQEKIDMLCFENGIRNGNAVRL